MAYFQAIGVIANELVRRETKAGVVTCFRFVSGVPGKGQLWIDAEAWGRTAGTLNVHGVKGRSLSLAGRLTYKEWRDRGDGTKRHRVVVTVADFDFLDRPHNSDQVAPSVHNQTCLTGRVESVPVAGPRPDTVTFDVVSGRAGSKTGRLWLAAQTWGNLNDAAEGLAVGDAVHLSGRLAYRKGEPTGDGVKTPGLHYLRCTSLAT